VDAIRHDPNLGAAYWGRGSLFLRKGDYDKAITDLSKSILLSPKNNAPKFSVSMYSERGSAYMGKGDYDSAIADWETVLQLDPDNHNAKSNIEKARQKRGR
jgi:tetratricopeptide (TPR) repeat protein